MGDGIEIDLNGKKTLALNVKKTLPIAPKSGIATKLKAGDYFMIEDPNGRQAVDFWAFNAANIDECLSAEHTRVWVNRLFPKLGESFHTNHRRPIVQLVADTCGVHDMLTAACDSHRYRLYGVQDDHPSCAGNLQKTMAELGHKIVHIPSPVNFFAHVEIGRDGTVMNGPMPPSKAGDHVILRAWIDCYVSVSACPQEFNPISGWYPTELNASILAPA